MTARRLIKNTCQIAFMMLFLLSLCACGGMKADISAYGDEPITVMGLSEEEFVITPNELAEMDCVTRKVTGSTAKAGTVQPVGPTLDTFLAAYGRTADEFERIRFYASDGYYTGFLADVLEESEIILAIANGDEPLKKSELPLRLVVPDKEGNQWIRMVTRIECYPKQ